MSFLSPYGGYARFEPGLEMQLGSVAVPRDYSARLDMNTPPLAGAVDLNSTCYYL